MKTGFRVLFAAILRVGVAVAATAQGGPALEGRVTDGNGSALPGVTIEARAAGRHMVPVTSTDRQGAWRPLIEENSVRSRSSTIVNAQLGYGLVNGLRIGIDVFNVLNARVSDIDYSYASRLPGEPADGVNDVHLHPAEPRSARAFVSYGF